MIVVGIDVSKNKHDIAILNSGGEILLKHLRIPNNREGFNKLQLILSNFIKDSSEDLRIALEDTGHYSFNIITYLRKCDYQVFSYNPLLIKEFAKSNSLRKTKTDKKDAMTIAQKLLTDFAPERFVADQSIQDLKYLTRHRYRMIKKQSDLKVQYTKVLDLMFPELALAIKGYSTHNQSTYELFKKYPNPQKIQRARLSSIININGMKAETATIIHKLSNDTIGTSSEALEFELLQTIHLIEEFKRILEKIDKKIGILMDQIDSKILSIPGISYGLGSVILAEIRNINNFKNPSQLLAFAGLEPSIYQSGQMDNEGKMVKRGSSHLRSALIKAARLVARWSPVFSNYLSKKISQGKHYNVAVSHVAKKLVRIIFYLLKTNTSFDEDKLT